MNLLSSLPTEQFIRAHYYNWRNGVQHRAISLDNLICSSEDQDPVCAVLNDWDLGIDHAKDPNLTHTGFEVTVRTVPFMAIDLLTQEALDGEVAVLYRHDLEALIWVLIWAVCCYDNGKMVYTVPQGIYNWNVRDPLSCGDKKYAFLARCEPIQPASDNWGEGFKLAQHLLDYLAGKDADRMAKAAVTMPHEQEEEDDPEHVWYELWAHLKILKELVPCIADFMPKDLRKAGDTGDKQ
ncbi:hypothetical protein ONZ51_g7141 [Trametes cubensis]|uniref:Fungal-type protein kinase domain-containing protein n=1 Tax=Trametes cubensis TaxID=1111947 RepID=A0AAD7X9F8_9APHY|nr:hypothetical protein ONZ51_g7141 [Trametes cubensis]